MKKIIATLTLAFAFLLTIPTNVHAQEIYVNSVDRALDSGYLHNEEDTLLYYDSNEYGMYEAAMEALKASGVNTKLTLDNNMLYIEGVKTGIEAQGIDSDGNLIGLNGEIINLNGVSLGTEENIIGTNNNTINVGSSDVNIGTNDTTLSATERNVSTNTQTYSTNGILDYFDSQATKVKAEGLNIQVPQIDFDNDGNTKSNMAENTTNKVIKYGLIGLYLLSMGFIIVEIVAGKHTVWSVIMGLGAMLFISALFFYPELMLNGLFEFMTT